MPIIMSTEVQAGPGQKATPAKPVATDGFAQVMSDFFSPSGRQVAGRAGGDAALPSVQEVAVPDVSVDVPAEEVSLDVAADLESDAGSEPEMDPSGIWPPVPQLAALRIAPLFATPPAQQMPSGTSGALSGRVDSIPLAFVAQGWGKSLQTLEASTPSAARDIAVGAQADGKLAFASVQGTDLIQEDILNKTASAQLLLDGSPKQLSPSPVPQGASQLQMVAALPREDARIRTADGAKMPDTPPNRDRGGASEVVTGDRLQADPRLGPSPVQTAIAAKSDALAPVDGALGFEGALQGGGERVSTASVSGIDVKTAPPAQVATAAAQQMAVAVQKNPAGVTEMILNPEELGRVKLAMATSDGAVTLTITTERPETQDLMRRHIEVLAQELRQLGFGDVGFSFRSQGDQEQSDETGSASVDASTVEADIPEAQIAAVETSGLDLRL